MAFSPSHYNSKFIAKHYSTWISEKITETINEEGDAYFVSFMFNALPGNQKTKLDIMRKEMEIFYTRLLTRCVRNTRSQIHLHKRPIFFASPDLPVYKHNKDSLENILINDGLHMHAIIIIRKSNRFKISLQDHIKQETQKYKSNTRIRTIHTVPIDKTPEKVSDYALKAIGRHFDSDAIIIEHGPPPQQRRRNLIDHYVGE